MDSDPEVVINGQPWCNIDGNIDGDDLMAETFNRKKRIIEQYYG